MSNQPPLPPYQGQPAYGVPQQGYSMPPQGYGQAPYPGGPMPQPQQGNGWALAALITSLVGGCVPFLGGLLAVLFGFLGIRRAGKTGSGKGLAIAGLIIGLLSIGGWTLFGGGILALIKGTEANREVARQFVTELKAGNADKAAALTDTSAITPEEIEGAIKYFKQYGTVTDITGFSAKVEANNGTSTATVVSIITFSDGKKVSLATDQIKINDQWKIRRFASDKAQ